MTKHKQRKQQQHPSNKKHLALNLIATAAAAAIGAIAIAPSTASATIKINEVMLNAPGGNAAQDFIELKSTTGGIEAFDLYMVMLEGDAGAAGGAGAVDTIVPLTGSTGANGLWLRHSFSVPINPAPHADTVQQGATYGHENAAATWVLVSGFTGAVGNDLDTNDDGILDSTPWTAVFDAVGSGDGDSNGDRTYGAALGGADFNVNASGMPTPTDGKPEVIAFRDPNGAMHIASVMNTATPPPVGGPYPVTNGGFTVQTGYVASPGNENNPVTTGARAWIGAAGGSFNTGANWTGGAAPTAPGDVAMFDGGGANTISLTADATAGVLTFDGGSHTIAAGGGTLTLDTVSGNANVLSQWGNPTINAPLKLMKTTNMRVARSTVLTLGNLNANGQGITKNGIGDLVLGAAGPAGSDIVASTVNVSSGSVKLASDGSYSRVLNANSLVMSGTTSRIDLTDNKLVTNTTAGASTGGIYNGVQGMVQKAYNFSNWDGRGIALLTSMPDAGPLVGTHTLGVASAEQILFLGATDTGTWAGQTVTGASTLVMYTYAGDLNFDGLVDGADYGVIDNYFTFPGTDGYANGDFNYDGVIDAGDYGIIDNTFALRAPPIPSGSPAVGSADIAGMSSVTAVPEPASISLLALGAAALLAHRRRRMN